MGDPVWLDHAYAVIGVEAAKSLIQLFNPWGHDHPHETGWISIDELQRYFVEVDINQ